jgi:hypothetical protein
MGAPHVGAGTWQKLHDLVHKKCIEIALLAHIQDPAKASQSIDTSRPVQAENEKVWAGFGSAVWQGCPHWLEMAQRFCPPSCDKAY